MKRNLYYFLPVLVGLSVWYLSKDHKPTSVSDDFSDQIAFQKAPKKQRAKDDLKYDHPDLFLAYHRSIMTGSGETAPSYPANYQMVELRKAQSRNQAYRTEGNNFKERGPGNVPGRTRALVVHPKDPHKTWYAGAAGGGVWKTTDGGKKWNHLTANLPTLSVASMAISSSNPEVLYVGTGEVFFGGGSGEGFGIFKTKDGGKNWEQLQSTAIDAFRNVSRIIVDPANENNLLASAGAATEEGEYLTASSIKSKIFKSTDGGASWEAVYDSPTPIYQLVAHKNDFNTIYATINKKGIIRSTDGGKTWENRSNGLGQVGRVELAISETNPNALYASAEGSLLGKSGDLYYSRDAGKNWKLLRKGKDEPNFDLLGGQASYDNTIMVHPYNDSIVYVGGVNTYKVQLTNQPDTIIKAVLGTSQENAQGFLREDFRIFTDEGKNITPDEFVPIEVRFGKNLTQKAYRFSVPEGRTSGVKPKEYTYQNIIDVPFEVWDTKNNRQLAVSVRDQLNDGGFNLKDNFNDSREYIFVHSLPYSATNTDDSIAINGGLVHKNMYLLWVAQPSNVVWSTDSIPEGAKLKVNYGDIIAQSRKTTPITDQYGNLDKKDKAYRRNSYKSKGGIHPDMHQLINLKGEKAGEFQILASNDGGIYLSHLSTDPAVKDSAWTMSGNTYNTSQFYGIAKVPNQQKYLGGTQDNGSWLFLGNKTDSVADPSDAYIHIRGGDGFECQWHAKNRMTIVASSQYNGFGKYDRKTGWRTGTTGLHDKGEGKAPFISRLAYTKSDPDLLFAIGASGVWRSDNFADNWQLAPIPTKWSTSGDVEVSSVNPQIVWAGAGMADTKHVFLSRDGGLSFTTVKNFGDIGRTSGIYAHPTEEGTAFVLFSVSQRAKILRTKDFGETWEDISGFHRESKSKGFANVPTYSILAMPHDPKRIWAGTEIGIFESNDEGQTWTLLPDFPNVSVWDMRAEDDEVVIATHGRGIWTATISELSTAKEPIVTLAPRLNTLIQLPKSGKIGLNLNMDLRSPYDSVHILRDGKWFETIKRNTNALIDHNHEMEVSKFDSIYVQAIAYKKGVEYKSGILSMSGKNIVEFGDPRAEYETTFDDGKLNLVNFGFRIGKQKGFTGSALHTDHPYIQGKTTPAGVLNYTSTLTFPIILAQRNAYMRFKEVAIAEPGEKNTSFGDDKFWDYVVVEGSKNLRDWKPIVDGYDASAEAKWLSAFKNNTDVDESMFREQKLDLGKAFSAGDTVYIRFRLYSDHSTAGFGWVIDDLEIQTKELVSAVEESSISNSVAVYPNPSPNGLFNLTINHVLGRDLDIRVYNTAGRLVHQESAKRKGLFFSQKIQLQNPNQGMYFVKISDGIQTVTKKLIVK